MKTILIPTDFSLCAQGALKYAMDLFAQEPIRFVLVHTFKVQREEVAQTFEQLQEQSLSLLEEQKALFQSRAKHPESTMVCEAVEGTIGYLPLTVIRTYRPSMVVMGTKGKAHLTQAFSKSNAGEFILRSGLTVLIVPEGAVFKRMADVIFATDFEETGANKDFSQLSAFLEANDATLHVLHVEDENKVFTASHVKEKERLQEVFKGHRTYFQKVREESVQQGVLEAARVLEADLICAIPKHNTFFERIFHLSVVRELVDTSPVPVLVLNQ